MVKSGMHSVRITLISKECHNTSGSRGLRGYQHSICNKTSGYEGASYLGHVSLRLITLDLL